MMNKQGKFVTTEEIQMGLFEMAQEECERSKRIEKHLENLVHSMKAKHSSDLAADLCCAYLRGRAGGAVMDGKTAYQRGKYFRALAVVLRGSS